MPKIKAAMWIHGNVVEVERPKPSLEIVRWGKGTRFTETSLNTETYWFHIPIPTPVILDDVRPKLNKIFITYEMDEVAAVLLDEVHIWDGGTRKWTWKSTPPHRPTQWEIDPPITIHYGLGISVKVVFGRYQSSRQVTFITAGADFGPP